MKKEQVIVYGTGKFAEYVSYVLSHDTNFSVSALCVETNFNYQNKKICGNLPTLNFDDIEKTYPPSDYYFFVAVGNNWTRERIFRIAKKKGYSFISYLSSKAILWENLSYGENVFISEGSMIQPYVTIGNNSIIISSNIGHHSRIAENVLLSCSNIAGGVTIGNNSFLALNSSVKQGIKIGNENIIGMGVNITKNTNHCEIYREKMPKKCRVKTNRYKNKYI